MEQFDRREHLLKPHFAHMRHLHRLEQLQREIDSVLHSVTLDGLGDFVFATKVCCYTTAEIIEDVNRAILQYLKIGSYSAAESLSRTSLENSINLIFYIISPTEILLFPYPQILPSPETSSNRPPQKPPPALKTQGESVENAQSIHTIYCLLLTLTLIEAPPKHHRSAIDPPSNRTRVLHSLIFQLHTIKGGEANSSGVSRYIAHDACVGLSSV